MDCLDSWLSSYKRAVVLLSLIVTISLVIFYFLYGFHPNNDTDSYISTIRFFRGEEALNFPNRYLNPLYGVLGATFFSGFSPGGSIVVTNVVFFFGVVLLTYGLISRVFGRVIGFFSALAMITAYPMIRYALTQVQDMGGYVWYIASLYTAWRWRENKNNKWLVLSGVSVSLGLLTKESGAMGALFFGVILLATNISIKEKIKSFCIFTVWPLATLILNQARGREIGYDSGRWYVDNWQNYASSNYTFFKWFGVSSTTFNLLWIGVIIGIFFLVKNWSKLSNDVKVYLLTIILPSFSYLTWPIFVGRMIFISAWLFVPVAFYGLKQLWDKGGKLRYTAGILCVLSLIAPYFLQSTLRYVHVFQILDACKRNISCSWNYFWENRQNFSKEM